MELNYLTYKRSNCETILCWNGIPKNVDK